MMTAEPMQMIDAATSDGGRLSFPDDRRIRMDADAERRIIAAEPSDPWYYPSGLSPIAELAWELGLGDPD